MDVDLSQSGWGKIRLIAGEVVAKAAGDIGKGGGGGGRPGRSRKFAVEIVRVMVAVAVETPCEGGSDGRSDAKATVAGNGCDGGGSSSSGCRVQRRWGQRQRMSSAQAKAMAGDWGEGGWVTCAKAAW